MLVPEHDDDDDACWNWNHGQQRQLPLVLLGLFGQLSFLLNTDSCLACKLAVLAKTYNSILPRYSRLSLILVWYHVPCLTFFVATATV